jgi:hypothetical protein
MHSVFVIPAAPSRFVIPGEPTCETRDPDSSKERAALGPGAPLRSDRDDKWRGLAPDNIGVCP